MFKKLSKLLMVLVIYLFLNINVSAFEFVKATENPLIINYIGDYTKHLQVNIFKEGGIYKGIFTIRRVTERYYSLGYFESSNGVEWQMIKEIFNTGQDLSNPSTLKTKTGYLIFITRYDNDLVYGIYSTQCDFEFNCSTNLSPVIMPKSNYYSENKGVFSGHPLVQDSQTYLFFGAWGGDGFKLKIAYSDDLVTWSRCPNDKAFLNGGDGPFPYVEKNDLYLFYHKSDSSGIKLAKTALPLTCGSVFGEQGYLLTPEKDYDRKHLIFPSVINENGDLRIFYSGLGSDNKWLLNYAQQLPGNPTPTIKIPIIILPGTFASWNREAILHNQEVSYKDWKLQSFVKEYDGLINTLMNAGYEKEKNLFLFPFDWRQSVEKTVNDFSSFLQDKIWDKKPDQKVNIIGHSLGGLVGRILTQKNKDRINQIITVGSPHQGIVQVYKPLQSGEVDRDNTFFWLAEKIILILNKSTIESDRITFINKFPIAKDLFPTFNFLKDSSGNEIAIDSLSIKNTFLALHNKSFSDIFSIFTAIYGEGGKNTPAGFVVEPQNSVDQLLGNYSDGKPKESYFDLGDYTVLTKSAKEDTDPEKLNLDHGGLIYKKDGIKKILELLHIQFKDSQIVEGKGTVISSSLIFMIKSPATISVEFNNDIYNEEDGIIFIPNAQSGNYNLKVQGSDQGKYEVIVGQISEKNDLWESIQGETTVSQIDDYNILYNSQTAQTIFPTSTVTPISGSGNPTPTIIPAATLIPHTPTPTTLSEITTPTILIISPQSTNSPEEILGISSRQEGLISPKINIKKQTKTKKEVKESSKLWNYFWLSIFMSILVQIGWFVWVKLTKNV